MTCYIVRMYSISGMMAVVLLIGCTHQDAETENTNANVADSRQATGESMSPFRCEVALTTPDGDLNISVYFQDQYAVQFDGEDTSNVAVIYDLDRQAWHDIELGGVMSIQASRKWAQASVRTTRASLPDMTDKDLVRFVEFTIDPKFDVSNNDNEIALENEFIRYRLSQPIEISEIQQERYFAYDRLNAYRKAMLERKLPPFAQLAVDEELEKRGFVPGRMEVTINTPNGNVDMTVQATMNELSDAEKRRVTEAIQEFGDLRRSQ